MQNLRRESEAMENNRNRYIILGGVPYTNWLDTERERERERERD